MKVTTSNKLIPQKKVERGGLDGKAGQGFENGSGNPSNSLKYNQGNGEQYHTLVTAGTAKASAVQKPGTTSDGKKALDAGLKRAERLHANSVGIDVGIVCQRHRASALALYLAPTSVQVSVTWLGTKTGTIMGTKTTQILPNQGLFDPTNGL